MSLLDFFTGGAVTRAAKQASQNLVLAQNEADRRLYEGHDWALKDVDEGQAKAVPAIQQGYSDARGSYETAKDGFSPYVSQGLKAWDAYNDAAGANGADGTTRAQAAFRAAPGYQYTVDQATDAAARKASSMGMLGSGNTAAAVTTLASNLADQGWNNYQSGLKSASDQGYAATGAVASLTKGQGDLSAQEGTTLGQLYDGDAARKAQINMSTGQAGSNSYQQFGQNMANVSMQKGQGQQAASGNLWGAIFGAGSALAGGLGSAFGGTGGTLGTFGDFAKGTVSQSTPSLLGGAFNNAKTNTYRNAFGVPY